MNRKYSPETQEYYCYDCNSWFDENEDCNCRKITYEEYKENIECKEEENDELPL